MPRIEFEADTYEELVVLVRQWVAGGERGSGAALAHQPPADATIRAALSAIRGTSSRRFVRELAEAASGGRAVALDAALITRYGRSSGTAFAGIVGGPNKVFRRLVGRDLIVLDPAAGGYRVDPQDAVAILAAWPTETTPAEG
jgi:hypothetical protein